MADEFASSPKPLVGFGPAGWVALAVLSGLGCALLKIAAFEVATTGGLLWLLMRSWRIFVVFSGAIGLVWSLSMAFPSTMALDGSIVGWHWWLVVGWHLFVASSLMVWAIAARLRYRRHRVAEAKVWVEEARR